MAILKESYHNVPPVQNEFSLMGYNKPSSFERPKSNLKQASFGNDV